MNMNYLRNLFRLRNDIQSYKLGRWTIHYEPRIIELKTKQANEDHCGCCFDKNKESLYDKNLNIKSLMIMKEK
jgi:hypothetical protein